MNNLWYQIEIEDPHLLDGSIILNIMSLLEDEIGDKIIIAQDVEGAGVNKINQTMNFNEFTEAISEVEQLVWGDFFFTNKSSNAVDSIVNSENISEQATKALLTIRGIDNQYINIFTTDVGILGRITENYPNVKVKKGKIESLEFYY